MAESKLDTQVRREQIAEAALSLVASQGVRRLSIASIARRVGLVPSGIYRHFKNKGEVLDAVLDLVEKRLHANVEAARPSRPIPWSGFVGCSFATCSSSARAVPCRGSSFPTTPSAIIPNARPTSAKS